MIVWRGRLGALAERPFRLLWTGQAVSSFGDRLLPVATVFAALEVSGNSAAAVGVVLAAAMIPRAALTLVGGVWADRIPRQRVMIAADSLRTIVQTLAAVLLLTHTARLWHLVVLSAVYGCAHAFFTPASTGLVPETVSAARLQQANVLMSLSRSAVGVGGPALAGVLVALTNPGWVYAIDAVTFAASVAFLAQLRLERLGRVEARSFLRELVEGWHEFTSRTWVWTSVVYFSITNLALAPFFVLGPLISKETLGGASAWGTISTGSALGFVLGGLVALRLQPSRPLLVGYLVFGGSAVELALLAPPAPTLAIAAGALAATAAVAIANALWLTALQEHVPRHALSRVSAYDWLGSMTIQPLGFAVAGPVADAVGVGTTLWAATACLVASTLAIVAVPSVRALRPLERTVAADAGLEPVS